MSCRKAIVEKVPVVGPDDTVERALAVMKKAGVSFVPVVDTANGGLLAGVFSLSRLLEDALPVAMVMSAGSDSAPINVTIPSAPGMGKRMQKTMEDKIYSIMHRPRLTAHPDMPIEEAVRMVCEAGGEPVPVTDQRSGAFLGLLTDRSVLEVLRDAG